MVMVSVLPGRTSANFSSAMRRVRPPLSRPRASSAVTSRSWSKLAALAARASIMVYTVVSSSGACSKSIKWCSTHSRMIATILNRAIPALPQPAHPRVGVSAGESGEAVRWAVAPARVLGALARLLRPAGCVEAVSNRWACAAGCAWPTGSCARAM